jgi:hypothetical protein
LKTNPSQNRVGGVAQGVGPEFKPQYCEKKKTHKKAECAGACPLIIPVTWKAQIGGSRSEASPKPTAIPPKKPKLDLI